jgi:transposase
LTGSFATHHITKQEAIVARQYQDGTKWTLILSISPGGVVAYQLMLDSNTSGVVFADYLVNWLFPALTQPRMLPWDNLGAHTTPLVLGFITASPHDYVNRPPYSPDLGPIECPFYIIKSYLRRNHFALTPANLKAYIEAGIATITPGMCYAWFHHCGYMP